MRSILAPVVAAASFGHAWSEIADLTFDFSMRERRFRLSPGIRSFLHLQEELP